MDDILYQLFGGDYDAAPERDRRQQELGRQIYAEMEKIQAVLGTEFLEHLFTLEAEQDELRNYQYYRSGFLLGVRLMLEVLRSD